MHHRQRRRAGVAAASVRVRLPSTAPFENAGVRGNTAANVTRQITTTGLRTFTLDGTTSNGTYDGGGAIGDGGHTFPSDSGTAGIWTRAVESEVGCRRHDLVAATASSA